MGNQHRACTHRTLMSKNNLDVFLSIRFCMKWWKWTCGKILKLILVEYSLLLFAPMGIYVLTYIYIKVHRKIQEKIWKLDLTRKLKFTVWGNLQCDGQIMSCIFWQLFSFLSVSRPTRAHNDSTFGIYNLHWCILDLCSSFPYINKYSSEVKVYWNYFQD